MIYRLLRPLLPADWREAIDALRHLAVVSRADLSRITALSVLVVLTEAFGLFMLLPILQFIENNGDVAALAEKARLWRVIVATYAAIGLPVTLISLSAVVFILVCIRQLIAFANITTLARIKERIARDLRRRAFNDILASNGAHIQRLGSGSFIHLIHTLCPTAAGMVDGMARMGVVILSFLAYGSGLLLLAPAATAATIVFALVLGRGVRTFRLQSRQLSERLVGSYEAFVQYLNERYLAWRLIKLTGSHTLEDRSFAARTAKIGDLAVAIARAAAMMQLFIAPAAALFALVGLFIAVERLNLTIADVTMFVIVLMRIVPLVNSTLSARQRLTTVAAGLVRAREILDSAMAQQEQQGGTATFERIDTAITFDQVSFVYDQGDHPALRDISLSIPAGKMTAITGPSGAGKSTLVDLLPRLIRPSAGRISIDGVPLEDFSLVSLRRRIAFVSQSPLLFGDSILENVRYGRPQASLEEVATACRHAYADEFIDQLEQGYQTLVGEGGARLSGGQRQRLMLARAFLSNAGLLILDEPTSSLDYQSEQFVQKALAKLRAQTSMTVIVIAHRLSTIRHADQIIVLEQGKLKQHGSPESLRQTSGWYARALALDGTDTGVQV